MMAQQNASFRISSHLKDLIGRELVTNEFVAIFELVKNAIDAMANRVHIEIDPANNQIAIADNGKGMTEDNIREKWLFVAYSAKADGTEDQGIAEDYRDKIRSVGSDAGSKGIGRFSCDTLGAYLQLLSRSHAEPAGVIHKLAVNWNDFEQDSSREFVSVNVELESVDGFPVLQEDCIGDGSGTILLISHLRHNWDIENVRKLRQYLAKLIDPFGSTESAIVTSTLIGSNLEDTDINGPIQNHISDILEEKTAKINVEIKPESIVTILEDRGKTIYKISEPNPYDGLTKVAISGSIYYLNRSAKATFTRRMSMQPVKFGSVFLFLNHFRIFPIGEEIDDTFGLNRRKQQGQSRMLGTRDILGRIDIDDPDRVFREATSRDAGLIEDEHSRQLVEAVRKHIIFRLERYVVGVNWPDKADQDRETSEGLELDSAKSRILNLIGSLAKSRDIEILYFDRDIVDLVDSQQEDSEQALRDLTIIAKRENDEKLLKRIEGTRKRIIALEESETAARKQVQALEIERKATDKKIGQLVRQARFLSQSQNLDADRIQLLLHQISIYSNHIKDGIIHILGSANELLTFLSNLNASETDVLDQVAGTLRHQLRGIRSDMSGILLENKRLQAVSRFSPNIQVTLGADKIHGDIVVFLDEYFNVIMPNRDKKIQVEFTGNGVNFDCNFSPFDIAVIIDNLVDNAKYHKAQKIQFTARLGSSESKLEICVSDDGLGFDLSQMDPGMIFEKHYTTKVNGTGLGLYHVRQVLKEMNGMIEIDSRSDKSRADFVISIEGGKK